ncbi:(5-formylfuran-3-yl)methyl phosphate synthase [Streptomyces polygonati]|uniref:(5-formylfuran-3-yl)methyl phosphate synthase n=1 Tax=Streptomyces polygonati TaxID=1617087 RepID=A0ABV8HKR6_9ACTN
MRLFVSSASVEEAMVCAAVARHLDLIDVVKPDEGSLGANYPWVVRSVREAMPAGTQVSASLGDALFRPGTMAQAALGAAAAGADFIKVGLFGVSTPGQAIELMRGVVRAVKEYNRDGTVVAVGYADARRIGSVGPLSIPYIAHESGADGAMVDTAIKDGSNLFDHLSPALCGGFVSAAHEYGLLAALAGSVQIRHVPELVEIDTDILAVRGAVCSGGDRDNGTIQPDLVLALRQAIDEAEQDRTSRRDRQLPGTVDAVA